MKEKPTPQQVFVVLQMYFGQEPSERERKYGDVRPVIKATLMAENVLRIDQRGRAKYLVLGDEADEFIMTHLGDPLPEKAQAGKVLQVVLGKVRKFLETQGHSVEDVFGLSSGGAALNSAPVVASDPANAIRNAYLAITHGEKRQRVRIADLRARVRASKSDVDATLMKMQAAGQIVLYKLDNPYDISEADRESALYIANEPRHVVYLET